MYKEITITTESGRCFSGYFRPQSLDFIYQIFHEKHPKERMNSFKSKYMVNVKTTPRILGVFEESCIKPLSDVKEEVEPDPNDVATATGIDLDRLGELVGVRRYLSTDHQYRNHIQRKVDEHKGSVELPPIIPTDTDSPEQIESRERRELINRLADCSQHLKGLIKAYDSAHKHQAKNINELVEAIDENRMSKNILKDAVNHLSENIQTMECESDDKTKYLVDHLRRMEISNQLLARELQLNTDALLYKPKKITTMDKLRAGLEVAKLLLQTINNYREISKENKRYYRG